MIGPRFTGVFQSVPSLDLLAIHISKSPYPSGRGQAVKKRTRPSAESAEVASSSCVLMFGPRLTGGPQGSSLVLRVLIHMSLSPKPPGRSESQTRTRPSGEMLAASSKSEVLIVGPRLTGAPHSLAVLSRFYTHKSWLPCPPGRSESQTRTRPSAVMLGWHSVSGVLIVWPSFTDSPQGSLVDARVVTHRS